MTKSVRIENADTSDHKLVVKAQVKNAAGEWVDEPALVAELNFPTSMAVATVWRERRLIIEEQSNG